MKKGNKLWSRQELILALHLYFKIDFGKISQNSQEVIDLAKIIGRTPDAVSFKLSNFSSLDPCHINRGVKGLPNAGKLTEVIWGEYYNNLGELSFEAEKISSKSNGKTLSEKLSGTIDDFKEGMDGIAIAKYRIGQSYFRNVIVNSYNHKCAITGLQIQSLLVASHIVPWAKDKKNRLNLSNGICLNVLHDRAFDQGLITITPKFKVRVSKNIFGAEKNDFLVNNLISIDKREISLPYREKPNKDFLEYHNKEVFRG